MPRESSPWLERRYQEVAQSKSFDGLIGEVLPIQQVHFLVRRFVQLTGAKWEYRCLSLIEKDLNNASALRWVTQKKFPDITIELGWTPFRYISGVTGIGQIENADATLHNVGINLFWRRRLLSEEPM